jgi:undecaprenyl pyrophosphate synthase
MSLGAFLKSVGIYRLYEKWLQNQIKDGVMPQHIGIILDGNRRWAMQKAVPRMMGHTVGAKTGEEFLDWCLDLGIRTLTIWIFSTENFNRSNEEVRELFDIVESEAGMKDTRKRIGDVLIGDDGMPRTVTELCSGEDAMYKVTQTHGMEYTVNSHHKLALKFCSGTVNFRKKGEMVLPKLFFHK